MKIILTGSQIYGPAREDSDIDFVYKKENEYQIIDILESLTGNKIKRTKEQDLYGGGFYINAEAQELNGIVVLSNSEFNAWEMATNEMKKISPIHNRDERIAKFQNLYDKAIKQGQEV